MTPPAAPPTASTAARRPARPR
ncbi:MAG: hypothetical protein JWM31_1886, partial [Solirubrobacterales bacterium]|nr:hypothetical protein [Solirubrobacterales bacterium]